MNNRSFFGFLVIISVFLTLCGCDSSLNGSTSGEDCLTGVEMNAVSESISASGSTTLTAVPTVSGSPDITYSWKIASGSKYVSLSTRSGDTVTLTGKNTDTSSRTVKIKVTATDGANSHSDSVKITVAAVDSSDTVTSTDYVSSVEIYSASKISSSGSTKLNALVSTTGSPTLTYQWEITSGSDYASLSNDTSKTATLTGNNSTASNQTVKIKVTVSDGTNIESNTTSVTIAAADAAVDDEITSVSISSDSDEIDYNGSVTLTASPTYTGSPTLTYTWSITSGSDYASLSSTSGESVILTGTNSTSSAQTVTVKISATDGTNREGANITITVNSSAADSTASTTSTTIASAVSSVTITGATTIEATGDVILTAVPVYTGSPIITYEWEITSGSDYGTLSPVKTNTVTLTGTNTDENSAHGVKVKVTASDGTNECSASFTVTVAAVGVNITDAVTSVTASAKKTSIKATASTKLSVSYEYTGSPTVTYQWAITEGSAYADLSGDTGSESLTLVGKNEDTTSAHDVTVKVIVSDGNNDLSDDVTVTVGMAAASSGTLYLDLTNNQVGVDNANYQTLSTSAVEPLTDVKVKYTEDDSTGSSTGVIRINAKSYSGELSVYITGSNNDVNGVKIQTNGTDAVNVTLDSVTLTSTNYPCLDITKGSDAAVTLVGTNTFTDGRSYGTGYGEEYSTTSGQTYTDDEGNVVSCTVSKSVVSEGSDNKGTLYCKGHLTINGSGSLSVTQTYKNCIASKDGLLTINGGTFTLTNYTSSSNTGKNGMFGGRGIDVNGGSITFNGYGIISTSDLRKANAFKTDDDDYENSYVKLNGGTVNVTTYNGKGITAPIVYIAGGTNTFAVTGITTYAENSSTGSYYDADGVYQSNQTIKFAAEGIEAASTMTISGGTTLVTSTDDGLNVSTTGGAFSMSDGFLYVKTSGGDGIDSNGNIAVSGGVIVSIALTGSEDALDWGDGSYTGTVTGGYIAGLCGNVESPSVSNAGVVIYNSSTAAVSAGQTIAIGSSTSDIVYAFTVPAGISSYTNLFMGSALMTGSSYTVYKACTVTGGTWFNGLYYEMPTVTAEGTTASVTLSSHIYSNGSGMGGGGQQGGPGGSSGGGPGGNKP